MQRIRAKIAELFSRAELRRHVAHHQEGSEIAQMAVLTGAVVAVGIGVALAFMTGMGTFFASLVTKIQAMVP